MIVKIIEFLILKFKFLFFFFLQGLNNYKIEIDEFFEGLNRSEYEFVFIGFLLGLFIGVIVLSTSFVKFIFF